MRVPLTHCDEILVRRADRTCVTRGSAAAFTAAAASASSASYRPSATPPRRTPQRLFEQRELRQQIGFDALARSCSRTQIVAKRLDHVIGRHADMRRHAAVQHAAHRADHSAHRRRPRRRSVLRRRHARRSGGTTRTCRRSGERSKGTCFTLGFAKLRLRKMAASFIISDASVRFTQEHSASRRMPDRDVAGATLGEVLNAYFATNERARGYVLEETAGCASTWQCSSTASRSTIAKR